MATLSIDVGIKNLAHCLLEGGAIKDWRVVDLTPQLFCSECKKRATVATSEGVYRCKKHAPESDSFKDKTPEELVAICKEKGLDASGAKRSLVARLNKAVKVSKVQGALQMPDTAIASALCSAYDTIFKGFTVSSVVIENQMAARLKPMQGMLIMYWTAKGATVHVASPLNKLKALNAGLTSYAERKKLGVARTRELLKEQGRDDSLAIFEKSKKKDDLADAYLQGVWFTTK
jgi:hypothetical protein